MRARIGRQHTHVEVSHHRRRQAGDQHVGHTGPRDHPGVASYIRQAGGGRHRSAQELMRTRGAVTAALPPAVTLMLAGDTMFTPPALIVTILPAAWIVMLSGVMRSVVAPTCSRMLVGVIACIPAGESITVWCGPAGDGGVGAGTGDVGPV